jgi:hypothetical protein
VGNVLGELRACGGVDGIGGRKTLESSEWVEGLDNFLFSDGRPIVIEV